MVKNKKAKNIFGFFYFVIISYKSIFWCIAQVIVLQSDPLSAVNHSSFLKSSIIFAHFFQISSLS